jgi:hypothetical protein
MMMELFRKGRVPVPARRSLFQGFSKDRQSRGYKLAGLLVAPFPFKLILNTF